MLRFTYNAMKNCEVSTWQMKVSGLSTYKNTDIRVMRAPTQDESYITFFQTISLYLKLP